MKHRLLPFLLCGLLLSGCASAAVKETTARETVAAETIAETVPEETGEAETEAETLPQAEAFDEYEEEEDIPPEEGLVRSPLTHEWITEEMAAKRPIAVMFPIDKAAQPQYGISRASVFYEIMEEGSMSRQMGILEDWEDLDRIGNIRSIRDYFIYEALEWDSVIVHFGGPEVFVKDFLTREDVDNINGVSGAMGSDYGAFYRIPAGSRSAHTAYTDSKHLLSAFEKSGFARNHRENYWQAEHWKFASAEKPVSIAGREDAFSAKVLDMKGCYPITGTTMTYNEADGKYYRSIYGTPQIDAATGEAMAFDNIVIECSTWGERGAGYLYYHVLDGGHRGWFITRGAMIPVTWVKENEYQPTRFYDGNGKEMRFNTGKTMVFITREGTDSFKADDITIDL